MKRDAIGNVRSIRTEFAEWDLTGETWQPSTRVTLEEYRPDGKLAGSEFHFQNSPAQQSTNRYDDGGALVETQHRHGGELMWTARYAYDAAGRLLRNVSTSKEGVEQVVEEHAYEADETHRKVMHLPPMEGNVICGFWVEGIDFSVSTPGVRTVTTLYGADGLETEVAFADVSGEVLRRLVITRDELGRLLKSEVFFGGKPMVPEIPAFGAGIALMTEEHSYDAEGRRVAVCRRMFGVSEERQAYRYDDRGNRIATTREDQTFSGTLDENGQMQRQGAARVSRHESRAEYRFDALGNWIERVNSGRYADNPDFTPCSRELREITYFD